MDETSVITPDEISAKMQPTEEENKGLLYGSLIAAGIHAAAGGLKGGIGDAVVQGLAGGFSSYKGGMDDLYNMKKQSEIWDMQKQKEEAIRQHRETLNTINQQKADDANIRFYDKLKLQEQALKDKEDSLTKDPLKNYSKWSTDYQKNKHLIAAMNLKFPDVILQAMNPEALMQYKTTMAQLEAEQKWLEQIGRENFPNLPPFPSEIKTGVKNIYSLGKDAGKYDLWKNAPTQGIPPTPSPQSVMPQNQDLVELPNKITKDGKRVFRNKRTGELFAE